MAKIKPTYLWLIIKYMFNFRVDYMGVALIKVLENGNNGSVWVAEAKETYEVDIPDRRTIRKK